MIRLRSDPDPLVSILIVAFHRRDLLAECLRSIAARVSSDVTYQTVIVLNGSTRDVRTFVRRAVDGATVVCSDVNAGFAGACNLARRHAAAPLLALLNDDTEVEEGWLEQLVATASANPAAGAVGSAVFFPDGRLQEAGSIIWQDGSTSAVGRGAQHLVPEYDFVRDVDYCSACSLLVRARTWDAVGGMDEGFFPAYYEDADLCMKIRHSGERVLYTPRSRVRHHEGASSDTHFRSFLIRRNCKRFRSRWRSVLSASEPAAPRNGAAVARAIHRGRGHRRRLLIIDDRIPEVRLGSGFGRMDEVIEAVGAENEVTFWCSAVDAPPSDRLRDAGVRVVRGPLRAHLSTPEELYDAVLISRPHNFDKVAGLVCRTQPHAAIVYDAEAVYHRRLERQVALAPDERIRAALAVQHDAIRTLETGIRRHCDAIVTINEQEAQFFASSPGNCPIVTIKPELPWARTTRSSFQERADVVFVAGWLAGAASPNGDGLRWFLNAVWPDVRAQAAGARLIVTGDVPSAIASEFEGLSVLQTGVVPDLYDIYDRARVAIVPLRFGAGLSIKCLEALKFGVPVVTTSVGRGDLHTLGTDVVCTADTASEFVAEVTLHLTDAEHWNARRTAILDITQRSRPGLGRAHWRAVIGDAQCARTPTMVAQRFCEASL